MFVRDMAQDDLGANLQLLRHILAKSGSRVRKWVRVLPLQRREAVERRQGGEAVVGEVDRDD